MAACTIQVLYCRASTSISALQTMGSSTTDMHPSMDLLEGVLWRRQMDSDFRHGYIETACIMLSFEGHWGQF